MLAELENLIISGAITILKNEIKAPELQIIHGIYKDLKTLVHNVTNPETKVEGEENGSPEISDTQ